LRTLRDRPIHEILDVGAGSGFFSRYLLTSTEAARAVCVDSAYGEARDDTCNGKPILFRRSIENSNADVVLLMDVLEHVDDEGELLRPYIDSVAPGARFVVTVPAFQFLWSSHDVFLEHRRRYTIGQLVTAVESCGLTLDRCHYYYAFVFPIAAAMRLFERFARTTEAEPKSQLRPEPRLINNTLTALCAAERPIMRANRLFGLSVFGSFHKP
jgi:trans-aconitate methyltransferase